MSPCVTALWGSGTHIVFILYVISKSCKHKQLADECIDLKSQLTEIEMPVQTVKSYTHTHTHRQKQCSTQMSEKKHALVSTEKWSTLCKQPNKSPILTL